MEETTLTIKNEVVYNEECVICFENIQTLKEAGKQVEVFSCNHQLCYDCAEMYILDLIKKDVNIHCPLCRNVLCYSNSDVYQQTRASYIEQYTDENDENDEYDEEVEQVHRAYIEQSISPFRGQPIQNYQTPSNRWFYVIPFTLLISAIIFFILLFVNVIRIN